MAANIGPRFALFASAPREWNLPALVGAHQLALRTSGGDGFLVEVHSAAFREELLKGDERWVFLAEIVREDADVFYAFENPLERALFVELRELDSIGPAKAATALAVLGTKVLTAMLGGQVPTGLKVTGFGPKTLEKLAHGIKDRRVHFEALLCGTTGNSQLPLSISSPDAPFSPQILQALERLGMKAADTVRIHKELKGEKIDIDALPAAELLRLVFQRWGMSKTRSRPSGEAEV
jgi:Holliday junction resolvasome RuvABC DNA-binding subunit